MPETRSRPAGALVLFDIDGTLTRGTGPYHREALVEAARRVTGLATTTDHIPLQGMLDRDILAIMLRNAGAGEGMIRRHMPAMVRRAQAIYVRRCPDLRGKVCPGARALLARLARHGAVMGLVTGNLSRIGWKKMERAGLKHYFRFGAFSELARDRAGLAHLALRTARRSGWVAPAATVALVGDHANDILAARSNGIRSVAVATGVSSLDELAGYSPDVLVPDLRSLSLRALLGAD